MRVSQRASEIRNKNYVSLKSKEDFDDFFWSNLCHELRNLMSTEKSFKNLIAVCQQLSHTAQVEDPTLASM